jgi:hypothetical protein
VTIRYLGDDGNLHQFWDRLVIQHRLGTDDYWERPFSGPAWSGERSCWSPDSVASWTDESHALVAAAAYPPGAVIDDDFADQTWLIIRQQWQKAAIRLARILNATIGDGTVSHQGACRE